MESQLLWPRTDNGTISETPDPKAFDFLPSYVSHERLEHPYVAAVLKDTIKRNEFGNREVIRAGIFQLLVKCDPSDLRSDEIPEELPVVCKVAHGRRQIEKLKKDSKEADIYNENLRDHQGRAVPEMMVCYIGKTAEGCHVGVLILTDCGEPLVDGLAPYSMSISWCGSFSHRRGQVVLHMLAIHRAGVEHRDIHVRNILAKKRNDGQGYDVTIVDFDRSERVACQYKGDEHEDIVFYRHPPDYKQFGCKELYKACDYACLWIEREINLGNQSVPVEEITDIEAFVDSDILPNGMTRDAAILHVADQMATMARVIERRKAWDENPRVPQ
ncbi:hypothetical protein NUW54_g7422 [Trametes sanguinea]|uniref:Uncharacterized protein n=1 Tax=Trametes sanguinea TaxID=158606 RepID=A0ACC1PKN6_9APHY|nr:hypothetical protein NUW54_g7422 [Trametes sanguinea]